MRVTSEDIAAWAKKREAQGALPILVRRLIHASGVASAIDMPGGDAVAQHGWDGIVQAGEGSSWVPAGKSYWEVSCSKRPATKAEEDFNKRTKESDYAIRKTGTFIFVTARKWQNKRTWAAVKNKDDAWAKVQVYDAVDLEQWLEHSLAVAIWFLEELGRSGPGIESLERYWDVWAKTKPPLTRQAILAGHEWARDRLVEKVAGGNSIVSVHAASIDEAAAFVAAALAQAERADTLINRAVVVTREEGWRYADANPRIGIVLAARPELAERQLPGAGRILILPFGQGDRPAHFRGQAVVAASDDANVHVGRLWPHEFRDILQTLGMDRGTAERCAKATGRSWSAYRRLYSTDRAISNPAWLRSPEASALSAVCLVGAWDSDQSADKAIIEGITERTHEDMERNLRVLLEADDAPVLLIGTVWKAKSPWELLRLFGSRITPAELDRFFETVRNTLSPPDPVLDLPEHERWSASIRGKIRAESGLVFDSLCDSLIKLAVAGSEIEALGDLQTRVAALVRELIVGADRTRWLSLASVLPALAEAAPQEFLNAVESSLQSSDSAVSGVLMETQSSNLLERCWHAEFLWALEMLAWSPKHVARVAVILTRLSNIEIKGNWANTPFNSLLQILHSWMPQTSAPIRERIAVLDLVIGEDAGVGWRVLQALFPPSRNGEYSARPKWRDYDRGAGEPISYAEQEQMLEAVQERQWSLAGNGAAKIADLVMKMDDMNEDAQARALDLAERFAGSAPDDDGRNLVRTALRRRIHWHYRNHDDNDDAGRQKIQQLVRLYDALAPDDLVKRHAWLFPRGWIELPEKMGQNYRRADERKNQYRIDAINELLMAGGLQEVERLLAEIQAPGDVGRALGCSNIDDHTLIKWLARADAHENIPSYADTVAGCFWGLEEERGVAVINAVLEQGHSNAWNSRQLAHFLAACPYNRATWNMVADSGQDVEHTYWKSVLPWLVHDPGNDDMDYMLRRLLQVERPKVAFRAINVWLEKVTPLRLFEILDQISPGVGTEAWSLEGYDIAAALKHVESDRSVARADMIRLQFAFYELLQHSYQDACAALFTELVSSPGLFCELVCMAFNPRHQERQPPDERRAALAAQARSVLGDCARLPGTQEDGSIDPAGFRDWVNNARRLCRDADREKIADEMIGEILARGPHGNDGLWPCEPVRALLDEDWAEGLRQGFWIGVYNSRGVVTRALGEGGDQERAIGDEYARRARAIQTTYPRTAALLDEIAVNYREREARHEDLDARLRRERD